MCVFQTLLIGNEAKKATKMEREREWESKREIMYSQHTTHTTHMYYSIGCSLSGTTWAWPVVNSEHWARDKSTVFNECVPPLHPNEGKCLNNSHLASENVIQKVIEKSVERVSKTGQSETGQKTAGTEALCPVFPSIDLQMLSQLKKTHTLN